MINAIASITFLFLPFFIILGNVPHEENHLETEIIESATAIAWHPSSPILAVAHTNIRENYIDLYHYNSGIDQGISGEVVSTLTGDIGEISILAWSSQGEYLAASSYNQTYIWRIRDQSIVTRIETEWFVRDLDWDSSATQIAISGYQVEIIDIENSFEIGNGIESNIIEVRPENSKGGFPPISWHPNFNMLAITFQDLSFWNFEDGSIQNIACCEYQYDLEWSPNGDYIATQTGIISWDSLNQEVEFDFLSDVAWHPDSCLLAGVILNHLHIIGLAAQQDAEVLATTQGASEVMTAVEWSPNGILLATLHFNGNVTIWNVQSLSC